MTNKILVLRNGMRSLTNCPLTLIKIHLAERSAPEGRASPVKVKQPTRFQSCDGIACFSFATSTGSSIQIIAQIVHIRSTVHHRITILSQMFRHFNIGVSLVSEVTDVTTVSLGSARSFGLSRIVAGFPMRVVTRTITETLFTYTLTAIDRSRIVLRRLLLWLLMFITIMLTTLAICVTTMRWTTVTTTAVWVRDRLKESKIF